ncbi:class I SAM-dependent methyltransferase [Streptomyces sp. XD-27]|uniref:class I SAM-dependent methyltransferase n=1 Tax=Streptomyces sp. XD-27 TaxID=3062779 RepID=UPI0026F46AAA|nr:class I SAM-dependent methyltransferase [Streptomyces sp. XD-27]WKX71422.1 class I SAM-dependent methyltransferase [Streptomyces sp. XD-27]
MSRIVNTQQAEAWNGYEGEHWAAHDDRYDAVNSGFNDVLLDAAALGERDRVLDIGCGNGQLTRLAARRAPLGQALGVDLSAPMLATARARAAEEGVPNVAFAQDDVQVRAFPDGGFDAAVSRFGVMFFADPVAAFTNVARALRPGGRLAFLCLTALDGTDLGTVLDAMSAHVPRPTGPDGTGPTSFADPARVRTVLAAAGFADVRCTRVEADQIWGRDVADAAAFLGDWGPVAHHLRQAGPDAAARARQALADALRPYAHPDAVRTRGTAWLVTAGRPTGGEQPRHYDAG